MQTFEVLIPLAALALTVGCASILDSESVAEGSERAVATAYPGMPEALTKRTVQDADQRVCSRSASQKLTSNEADQVMHSARASMRYPTSGKLVGDWKIGERLVNSAAGLRIRDHHKQLSTIIVIIVCRLQ